MALQNLPIHGSEASEGTSGSSVHLGYSLVENSSSNPSSGLTTTQGGIASLQQLPPSQHPDLSQQPLCSKLPPSLLQTVAQSLASRHLLLQGPPKSGRSSLIMELACSVASSAPCRCRCLDHPSLGIIHTRTHCSCVAVALFRPAHLKNRDDDLFPLPCHRHANNTPLSPGTAAVEPTSSRTNNIDYFPRTILRRIQIRWVASLHDFLHHLYSLSGKPAHERPFALLVDDLDRLCSSDSNNILMGGGQSPPPTDGPKMRARTSLALASLIDTANSLTAIERRQSTNGLVPEPGPVLVLATTTSSAAATASSSAQHRPLALGFSLPLSGSNDASSPSSWQRLSIVPATQSVPPMVPVPSNDQVVASRWTVQPAGGGGHSQNKNNNTNQHSPAYFEVLQSLQGGWRIRWTTGSSDEP